MDKASLLRKLLSFGSQTAPEVIEEAAPIAKRVSTQATEVGPEVIGKGTSGIAKEASEEIPDAVYKEITPTTGSSDMSWMNRMDPRLKKFVIGGGLAAGAGGLMMGGGDDEPPMTPASEPMKPAEPKKPEEIKKELKQTVKTEPPKKDGLDFDALSKKFDEGMAGLPKDAPAEPAEPDFLKMLQAGIDRRDRTDNESDLLRGSENLAAGLARIKPDYGSSEKRGKRAEQYKKDAEDQVSALQKQQQFTKAQADLKDEGKMRDPNSEISKLVSDLAVKTGLIKPGQQVSAMSLKNAGVNLGTLLSTIEAAKGRKEAAALARDEKMKAKEDKLSDTQRKFVQGLRKEATTGVLGKQYATFATGQRMQNSLEQFSKDPSGYKDYATLMGGLKSLQGDESVVREAEVRMGVNATSAINKAFNYAQSAMNGKQLQPEQRKEMIDTIKILTDASRQQYMHSVKPILEQATMENIDPELILSGSLGGAKAEAAPASDNNSNGMVKIIPPGGTKPKLIPADQADAAIKAGGKLVQ